MFTDAIYTEKKLLRNLVKASAFVEISAESSFVSNSESYIHNRKPGQNHADRQSDKNKKRARERERETEVI